jgi:4-hydroxybenzoate polyprenyltransferase
LTLSAIKSPHPWRSRLHLFWALSRTPHAIIDMAGPGAAALLCLGRFPSLWITLIGLVTVFSGYTAVYAINDLVDYQPDRRKFRQGGYADDDDEAYLDGALVRHPLAKGAIRMREAVLWVAAWSALAILGAYWLNPVCLLIFLVGCGLEVVYCLLWRITPYRALINGVVKTSGALAAVYAVNPTPSPLFLGILFLWIFFWEIGGQNIPNDWIDMAMDRCYGAKTMPVRFGEGRARLLSITSLILAFFLNMLVMLVSPLPFTAFHYLLALAANFFLLLLPALKLYQVPHRDQAMGLFNKASYYPLAMLGVSLSAFMV